MAFEPYPKIPRLNRDMVITEKIDGTNAQIEIIDHTDCGNEPDTNVCWFEEKNGVPVAYWNGYAVYAGSRKRNITVSDDNFGFARYVWQNLDAIVSLLGVGRHFGEWWGSGIQRGYGLQNGEKRFSLFNVKRWQGEQLPDQMSTVPLLYTGPFDTRVVNTWVDLLRVGGSQAMPGFMQPEGVIVFHEAARSLFKVTCKDDEKPKGSNE